MRTRTIHGFRGAGACSFIKRWLVEESRAGTMLEFALATPVLIILLGGAADLGLAQFSRASLADGVAAGAEYAYLTGASVSATDILNVVLSSSFLTRANLDVAVTGPAGYCVTGPAPTRLAATAGATCSDGSIAGLHVLINATYTSNGIMAGFMSARTYMISQAVTVMLK